MIKEYPIAINLNDEIYPQRVKEVMGNKAPKQLYMMGNLEILKLHGLGFCGSRKASLKGLETTKDCSEQAAKEDIAIISGNAAGVDFEAHFNSLKAGGKTIFVLPEGISFFKIKKAFEKIWDWHRTLVISQFQPNEIWQTFRAMERNNLIIALSDVMIVIEAGEKGGTLNAGQKTLKMGLPLYVAEYQDMSVEAKGNKMLLDMGAKKLNKSSSTNRANLKEVFKDMGMHTLLNKIPIQEVLL